LLAAMLQASVHAQTTQPVSASSKASPTSSPTSAPAHVVTLPPGFVRVVVGDRQAMCEAADADWVRQCLGHAPAGTQPSTRPADLLSHLQSQKESLAAEITDELDLKDKQKSVNFVSETLLPLVERLNRLRVKLIYLVITKQDLKRLVQTGWGSDQFHYNRVADKIAFDGIVDISLDGVDGESIVPAPFLATDPPEARMANLSEVVGRTEAGVGDMISRESQSAVQLSLAKFTVEAGLVPLNLKLDQDWFSAGVVGDLSSEFAAVVTGNQPEDIIKKLAQPDPNNPVSFDSIDLAHPIPPDQIRPQMADAYADAFRRRGVAVVDAWVQKAGPDAISKTLAAMHQNPPADDAALLALIRKTTGVDLTAQLASP
jgi:hypothetical protein